MRDVRAWLWRLLVFELCRGRACGRRVRARAELAWALLAGASRRRDRRPRAGRHAGRLRRGLARVPQAALQGPVVALQNQDTLIRVYPDRFWNWTGLVMGVLVLVQAVVAIVVGEAIRRAGRTRVRERIATSTAFSRCSQRGGRRERSTRTGATSWPCRRSSTVRSRARRPTIWSGTLRASRGRARRRPTVARRIAAARTFYRHLQLLGQRQDNPAADVPLPGARVGCRRRFRPARRSG